MIDKVFLAQKEGYNVVYVTGNYAGYVHYINVPRVVIRESLKMILILQGLFLVSLTQAKSCALCFLITMGEYTRISVCLVLLLLTMMLILLIF